MGKSRVKILNGHAYIYWFFFFIDPFFVCRATAMEVPRRSGKNRSFVGVEADGSSVVVHSVPIAERYFMCHPRAVLQQVHLFSYTYHVFTLPFDGKIFFRQMAT